MNDSNSPVCFMDSNIWLYAFIESGDAAKRAAALAALKSVIPVVSTQVINEVCVNMIRKAQMADPQVEQLIRAFYAKYHVMEPDVTLLTMAVELRQRYSFSFWDSQIVAAALLSGASLLYSEDMQAGLLVDGRIRISNPLSSQPATSTTSS